MLKSGQVATDEALKTRKKRPKTMASGQNACRKPLCKMSLALQSSGQKLRQVLQVRELCLQRPARQIRGKPGVRPQGLTAHIPHRAENGLKNEKHQIEDNETKQTPTKWGHNLQYRSICWNCRNCGLELQHIVICAFAGCPGLPQLSIKLPTV